MNDWIKHLSDFYQILINMTLLENHSHSYAKQNPATEILEFTINQAGYGRSEFWWDKPDVD